MRWIVFNFKKNRIEFTLLLLIILLAAFFRFYKIDEYMQFLGDQGRDGLVIKQILTGQHFPSIGPPSSVGTIYLGPLYYYMMAFSMLIFFLNPVAAAGMVALIGVATVGLIYYLSREWFGKVAAISAAFLYALSPVAINYSRFSWNPNPVPFFTLLAFLGIFKAHRTGNFLWFILSGASLAAVIQMHYLALILLPVFGILWMYELSLIKRKKLERKNFFNGTVGAAMAFFLLMSPLIFFDIRHEFLNYHGLINLFFGKDSGVSLSLIDSIGRLPDVYLNNLVGRYIAGQNLIISWLISLAILAPLIFGFYQKSKSKVLKWSELALTVWLIVGLVGLMFYKWEIYDHYLAFLSPLPFILFGGFLQQVWEKRKGEPVVIIILVIVAFANLILNPILQTPNRQLQKTQNIAKFIIQNTDNQPLNFALLSENNYDAAYQFYLEQYGNKPKLLPLEKTSQLFVVCENPECNPVGHPKHEIAAFGWAMIEWEEQVEGIKVFKLISNPEQPR